MSLPRVDYPLYSLKIPSTGELIQYRPFLVKENKILLLSKESKDFKTSYDAIKQIINNCTLGKVNVDKLAQFDIEYVFLKLRAKSVGEIAEFVIECDGQDENKKPCNAKIDISVNLDEIEVKKDPNHSNKIAFTDKVGFVMKYPGISCERISSDPSLSQYEKTIYMVMECIDYIYDESSLYYPKDYSRDEIKEMIESLTGSSFEKIEKFFSELPKLHYEIKYQCPKCKKEETIVLDNLKDFFE